MHEDDWDVSQLGRLATPNAGTVAADDAGFIGMTACT
jgi:hypothetical protein